MQKGSYKQEIVKNYFVFSLGTWLSTIISLSSLLITTRLIPPQEFGKAATFQMFSSFLIPICLLGMSDGFLRFYYSKEKDKKNELLWTSLSVPLIFSAAVSLLILIFAGRISEFVAGESSTLVPTLLIATLFASIFQVFSENIVRLENKGLYYSLIQIGKSLTSLIIIVCFALVLRKRTHETLLIATFISVIVGLSIGLPLRLKYWLRPKINITQLKELVNFSYPLIIAAMLYDALTFTDRFLLRLFASFQDIGLYSAGYKIISAINILTGGYRTFWKPYILKLYHEDPEQSKKVLRRMFDVVTFGVVAISLLALSAKEIVFWLLGEQYRAAAQISSFLLLIPASLLVIATAAMGLHFTQRTSWFAIANGTALAANVIGDLLLIPLYGAKGAAISTGLSMWILSLIEVYASRKVYPVEYGFRKNSVAFAILIFAAFVNTFFKPLYGTIVALIGLGVLMLLYRNITKIAIKDGMNIFRNLWSSRIWGFK